MKLFEKKNTLVSKKDAILTQDEQEQRSYLEKAAIAIACAYEKKDTEDIMLPQIVSVAKSKNNQKMLFEMENHQFLQAPRKYRINVFVEEVKS